MGGGDTHMLEQWIVGHGYGRNGWREQQKSRVWWPPGPALLPLVMTLEKEARNPVQRLEHNRDGRERPTLRDKTNIGKTPLAYEPITTENAGT